MSIFVIIRVAAIIDRGHFSMGSWLMRDHSFYRISVIMFSLILLITGCAKTDISESDSNGDREGGEYEIE